MKKGRKLIILCLIMVLLMSCAVCLHTGSLNSEEITLSAEELDEIAALNSEKCAHLLTIWSNNAEFPKERSAELPPFYAGVSTGVNNFLIIHVTRLDQDVIDYFASLIDLDYVHFSQVTHSLRELYDTQELIDLYIESGADSEICSAVTGTGISIEENAVNVYVTSKASSNLADIILSQLHSTGNSCNIQFITLDLTFGGGNIIPQTLESNNVSPHLVSGVIVEPGSPISPRIFL